MNKANRDPANIWDMVQAIKEIQHFTEGFSEDGFLETLWLQRVVERNLEILGEACRNVSVELQQAHPEIDWRNTVALRNVIAHRYRQIEYETLWSIVQTVLPTLLDNLEKILADMPKPE